MCVRSIVRRLTSSSAALFSFSYFPRALPRALFSTMALTAETAATPSVHSDVPTFAEPGDTFLGFPRKGGAETEFVVVGIPYDVGTSNRPGARFGPQVWRRRRRIEEERGGGRRR